MSFFSCSPFWRNKKNLFSVWVFGFELKCHKKFKKKNDGEREIKRREKTKTKIEWEQFFNITNKTVLALVFFLLFSSLLFAFLFRTFTLMSSHFVLLRLRNLLLFLLFMKFYLKDFLSFVIQIFVWNWSPPPPCSSFHSTLSLFLWLFDSLSLSLSLSRNDHMKIKIAQEERAQHFERSCLQLRNWDLSSLCENFIRIVHPKLVY